MGQGADGSIEGMVQSLEELWPLILPKIKTSNFFFSQIRLVENTLAGDQQTINLRVRTRWHIRAILWWLFQINSLHGSPLFINVQRNFKTTISCNLDIKSLYWLARRLPPRWSFEYCISQYSSAVQLAATSNRVTCSGTDSLPPTSIYEYPRMWTFYIRCIENGYCFFHKFSLDISEDSLKLSAGISNPP